MGRTHCLSGAATWLAGCSALVAAGQPVSPTVAFIGAVVAAGFSLLPDLDTPDSTISRSAGRLSLTVARGCASGARRLRAASCRHCRGLPELTGHRGVTHTVAFALAVGAVVALAGWTVGCWAGLPTVWVAAALAVRALLTRQVRGVMGIPVVATAAAVAAAAAPGHGWWWLGLPVAWGTLVHSLGDAMTGRGVPLAWPLQVGACRWRRLGVPQWMRFSVGGRMEDLVRLLLAVSSVAAGGYLLG
ncbi:metal-dependent hydrolase [Micromonospora arborensis]|uniref:metal-dependent hydrolase n=1 Tax=Micromonospora arborensis TaxID=2116518 RepID=UPI00371C83C8